MQTQLPLFLKWGIRFGEPYEVPEQVARQVAYVDRFELEQEIVRRRDDEEEDGWDDFTTGAENPPHAGGQAYAAVLHLRENKGPSRRPPLRTD